jgi:hypothetical protein
MKEKKDLNYIANLEKAIAKKYGEIAIKNPASFWNKEKEKEYLEQLKELQRERDDYYEEKIEANGFFMTKKLVNRKESESCSICNNYVLRSEDDMYMTKYQCCYLCYIKHREMEKHFDERTESG